MVKAALTRALVTATLVISLPAAVVAQSDPATPEGIDWYLASYADGGSLQAVPWTIDATLRLDAGSASGSSACNTITGDYTLAGDSLTFGQFATTLAACADDATSDVDRGYLAGLGASSSWLISGDTLSLSDDDGEVVLEFQQATGALTPSDIAAIGARFDAQQRAIERLSERVDNANIPTLRQRIRELENLTQRLQAAQAAARSNSSGPANRSGGRSFDASEQVLLQGIPRNIRQTCAPLRGGNLPSGTVAAVRCQPITQLVDEMAYYLMEHPDAVATLTRVMNANNVRRGFGCYNGREGWVGRAQANKFFQAEGCYVANGKANLRLFDTATECHRLNVAGTRMRYPTMYVAIEGAGRQIRPLARWTRDVADDLYTPYDNIMRTIPFGNGRPDGCPQ